MNDIVTERYRRWLNLKRFKTIRSIRPQRSDPSKRRRRKEGQN
jgi:hypothetical protein